jgi:hypothetical protein
MNGETLARVLRSLATAVERMTPMELEALPKQLAALRSVGDSFAGNARRPRPKAEKLDYGEVERLLSELRNAVSRDKAMSSWRDSTFLDGNSRRWPGAVACT